MPFPIQRLRRLRATPTLRRMTCETIVTPDDFIAPLFVENGRALQEPIEALPGQFRFSPDTAAEEARSLWHLGMPAVFLFGIPD
jgi:porphobilinogen synthase